MTWNRKVLPTLLLAGSMVIGANGWAGTSAAPDPAALAVIAGKPITSDIFKAEMARRQGLFDAAGKEELLDSIVRSELLFAAARTAGYENDLEVIATVKQAMVGKYLRDNLEPKLAQQKVSDQEAESYYQTHQAEFGTGAKIHGALIWIAVSPKLSVEKKAELRKRAEAARSEALALEPGVPGFGSVAVTYSEDQGSRYRGGDIGWLQAGAIDGGRDKKVSEALFALKTPGQVSPVVVADDGYYIVKLMETKAATVKPFAEVRDGVHYHILQKKKQQVEADFIKQLKTKIPVTVNSGMLRTIALPGEGNKAGPPALPAH